jgi:farnesyl-diphosphate farnesyltransferase
MSDRVVRADLDWCHERIGSVSRTFALTVSQLKRPLTDEICVGYLLCRVPDTIEDSTRLPPAEQRALLDCYSDALAPETETTIEEFADRVSEWIPADPDAEWETVAQAPRIVATFREFPARSQDVIRPAVRELTDGMAMFVDRYAEEGGLRIQTLDELEEYCWYVAGTVGTLVTGLLDSDLPPTVREQLWDNARSFALLLQLVNVAKDVAGDYREEQNVYLPAELLSTQGLLPADIDDPANAQAFVPVIEAIVDHAESYLDGAQAWIEAMPETRGNTLAAWAIPFLLAVGTLRELRERPEDVVETGTIKVPRAEVNALLSAFESESTPDIGDLRTKMAAAPLHEQ